jgi:hypothetical protein
MLNIFPSFKDFVKSFIVANGIYGFWILVHFLSAHLYAEWCTPKTFVGFISSPLLASSPHCNGLRWMINEGANSINAMWMLLATWFVSSYFILNKQTNCKHTIIQTNQKPP